MEAVNLNRLAYFATVVDTGSFTRAAERLGVTKAVVSQHVTRLEAELKTNLLVRTTRRVEPTEAGRMLHARCLTIFRTADKAMGEIAESNATPIGVLRIAATNDFGTCTIAPLAATFCRTYPACRIELVLSDARIDLIEHQIDLSVRIGWLDDSGFQTKRVGSFRQFLVASPELPGVSTARTLTDLKTLPFIANAALKDPLAWQFTRQGSVEELQFKPNLVINTTPAVLAATLVGGGLSVLPDFLAAEHVLSGKLVQVFPDWLLPNGGIHVVFPAARYRPPKVTSFVAMLAAEMNRN